MAQCHKVGGVNEIHVSFRSSPGLQCSRVGVSGCQAGINKIANCIEANDPKKKLLDGSSPQRAWVEICHEARRPNKLGYYTNTKDKPKVQLSTRVAPKEENHPKLKTNKVNLWYQGKLNFCRGLNVWSWCYDNKPIHVFTVDGMLQVGFMIPSQIMFVPRTKC